MNWTELLTQEIEATYHAADGLIKLVTPPRMAWKPKTGKNWMSMGQLLEHMTSACGACCNGFLTGDWGLPPGQEMQLPTADQMPAIETAAQAREKLAADKKLALECVQKAGEDALANKLVSAPWDPTPRPLGVQYLHMISHLNQHKGQLYYYLKLTGRGVNTGHLYGM